MIHHVFAGEFILLDGFILISHVLLLASLVAAVVVSSRLSRHRRVLANHHRAPPELCPAHLLDASGA
jgi:hypothetical protein